MIDTPVVLRRVEWPYVDVLVRLTLALVLGLFVGLERERRGKEAGLRTFGFVALLGALGGALGESFALACLGLTGVLAVFLNLQAMRADQGTELTTSAALLVTSAAGILCGEGHQLTPAAAIVITTALLAWKEPLAGFSMGLSEKELRSALLLAILAIVIYPALPEGPVGPWSLVEPRGAWLTVLLIAGIGFVNYVLWKVYGTRGTEIAGFLGGLVNSSVTVSEISARIGKMHEGGIDVAYRAILLATAAMVARNAVLLLILAPGAFLSSVGAHIMMFATSFVLVVASRRNSDGEVAAPHPAVQLELPFSLWVALKYGALFLALNVFATLAQRFAGQFGFYAVSFLGGLISSASAVAAAASLAANNTLSSSVAGTGAVIASLTSVLVNLPFALRSDSRRLTRRLVIAMFAIATAGAAGAWLSIALAAAG